jgi:CRISPR-associated protein Cmr6
LAEGERWKTLLTAAFAHAFQWLGFGAKTAVGYGAMQVDEQAIAQAEAQRLAAEKKAARASKSPQAQKIDDYIEHMQRRWKDLSGKPTRINGEEHNRTRQLAKTAREDPAWTAEEKRAAADAIDKWLPEVVAVDIKDERKKLKLAALRGE